MAKKASGYSVYQHDVRGDFKVFPGDGVVPGWSQVAWTSGTRRDAERMLHARLNPCRECGAAAEYPIDHKSGCSSYPYPAGVAV